MSIDWKHYFPWTLQPLLTQVSQDSQFPLLQSAFVSNSEFYSIKDSPAIHASNIDIQCLIDYTYFSFCSGSAVDLSLIDKGSFACCRSAFFCCSALNRVGYNSIRLNLDENKTGYGELTLSSFAKCEPNGNVVNRYNIYLGHGSETVEDVNISKCQCSSFAAIIVDYSFHIIIRRSNFVSNTANEMGIIYAVDGVIRYSNMIGNVELKKNDYYSGVVISNGRNCTLAVEQCFILNNTYLSNIPENVAIVKFIRCYIRGSDLNVSGTVSILSNATFDQISLTMFGTKEIYAQIPYRNKMNSCQLRKRNTLKLIQCLAFYSFFVNPLFYFRDNKSKQKTMALLYIK